MARPSSSAESVTLVFAGAIASVAVDGALGALAREPQWVAAIVTVLLVSVVAYRIAKGHTHMRLRAACGWLVIGLVAGGTVPKTSPPPQRITTHAVPRGIASDGADLLVALQALDDDPQAILGHRITVHGTWSPPGVGPACVWVRIMTCCAADELAAGFDVVPRSLISTTGGTFVAVNGFVRASLRDGELRYRLDDASVTAVRPASAVSTKR